MKLKKAVIPAAGLGTRFLPATKTVPKEMLPLFDAPTILFVMEEALQAGIEDIVLIAGRGKSAIEDFFDITYELEHKIAGTGKEKLLERVYRIRDNCNIISIRQKQALGLGHAVFCAQPAIGREPFAVLLGDEVMLSEHQDKNTTHKLARCLEQTQQSAVAVMRVPKQDVSKYGIVEVAEPTMGRYPVRSLVEKPAVDKAPSQFAMPGRYAFTAQVFDELREARPGHGGEIQLTDAMNTLAQTQGLHALEFEADRYDAGDKLGFMQISIALALKDDQVGPRLKEWLQTQL